MEKKKDVKKEAEQKKNNSTVLTQHDSPYDSKVMVTFKSLPSILLQPGLMVPPYTMMEGRLNLAMAITTPGMFLSHPGREMLASYHWPHITVSMLSAMMSRDGRL